MGLQTSFAAAPPFLFPIRPGQPATLSGTFAELRPDHFHTGIDIRTNNTVGWPVRATASGYLSRIAVSRSGYGLVVSIRHADGYESIYAHLDRLAPRFRRMLYSRQRQLRKMEVSIYPPEGTLAVRQGELIAFSGNTGSSMGPHLHFEIRKNGFPIDPMAYGFSELNDGLPPVFEAFSLRTLSPQSRLAGRYGRQEWPLTAGPSARPSVRNYAFKDTIRAVGLLGLDVLAYDQAEGSDSKNGLACLEVLVDSQEVHYTHIPKIPLPFNRDVNLHLDFGEYAATGRPFQHCYRDAHNNRLPFYRPSARRGQLWVQPGAVHRVVLTGWDAFQNKTQLTFVVKGETLRPAMPAADTAFAWELNGPYLHWQARPTDSMLLYVGGRSFRATPLYAGHWLHDVRRGLPDSAASPQGRFLFHFLPPLFPGRAARLNSPYIIADFTKESLYDTLYPTVTVRGNTYSIGPINVPLRQPVKVRIRPARPPGSMARTAVYQLVQGEPVYRAGAWQGGTYGFSVKSLGTYQLLTDWRPPGIRLLRADSLELRFRVLDNLSGVRRWKATLNGEDLVLNYDPKSGLMKSEKTTPQAPYRGEFKLDVTDNSGNRATFGIPDLAAHPSPGSREVPRLRPKRR